MVRIKRMRPSPAGDVPAISVEDRSICEEWLRSVDVSELDERWGAIKKNWKEFLSTTSPPTRRSMPTVDRHQRLAVQEGLRKRMDELETRSESWPEAARLTLNQQFGGQETTASLSARRSFQAAWIGMVCFLVYSWKGEKLEEMGLMLQKGQEQSLDKLVQLLTVDRVKMDSLHEAVHGLLLRAVTDGSSTIKNNMVLWWMAILVRSAVARDEQEDYISRGRFTVNILPIDIGLRQRVEALGHYSKALVLDREFCAWKGEERCVGDIMSQLRQVDDKWPTHEHELCLDDKRDKRKFSSNVCAQMVGHQGVEGDQFLEATQGMVVYEVRRLLRDLREKEVTRGKEDTKGKKRLREESEINWQ